MANQKSGNTRKPQQICMEKLYTGRLGTNFCIQRVKFEKIAILQLKDCANARLIVNPMYHKYVFFFTKIRLPDIYFMWC